MKFGKILKGFPKRKKQIVIIKRQVDMVESTEEITVYISLPDNEEITDEDSDEENVTWANLSGKQLTAAVDIKESVPTSCDLSSQKTKSLKAHYW